MTDVENEPAAEVRQCYICLEVAEPGAEESGWVSPCRCSGTMAWVHQVCLLRWVRSQEHHNITPYCAQCRTRFILLPAQGQLFSCLHFFYTHVVPASKLVAASVVTLIVFQSACVTMGVFALSQVYGVDDTLARLVSYEDPWEAVARLNLISFSLMFISFLPWQEYLLQGLRRLSRLPLLGAVLPADLPVRFREPPRKRSVRRILADAVLLPVFSSIIGSLFFSSVESRLSRVLIGGVVYLSVKCGFYMYLNQQLLKRQQIIRVLPVQEADDVTHTQD